jgi:ectoine hydroxylase-related dioxygenase (phytanoyl-CoA dioxygenase family)
MDKPLVNQPLVWMTDRSCSLEEFAGVVERQTVASDYPLASSIEKNVPIYDSSKIRASIGDHQSTQDFMAEWNSAFLSGPGIVVFKRAYEDLKIIDDVTSVLNGIIEKERVAKGSRGDHFGKAGENARVWNAHEKLCLAAPTLFARYNSNDVLALVSRSWLGPLYQITAQVNLVYPGGKAQTPHRDYHMGFQTTAQLEQYPVVAHKLSAALTLQGAIAHCDMPLESGPTKLLPYSQSYLPGYFAVQQAPFRDYFESHCIQLPLQKGDALFFNPALFHAAGSNVSSNVNRFANLLQVGSGYGRSIEIVNRAGMSMVIYPALRAMIKSNSISPQEVENVIAATAEGYPFPADLDIDSPLKGMVPQSQQDIMKEALANDWEGEQFDAAIRAYEHRRALDR